MCIYWSFLSQSVVRSVRRKRDGWLERKPRLQPPWDTFLCSWTSKPWGWLAPCRAATCPRKGWQAWAERALSKPAMHCTKWERKFIICSSAWTTVTEQNWREATRWQSMMNLLETPGFIRHYSRNERLIKWNIN